MQTMGRESMLNRIAKMQINMSPEELDLLTMLRMRTDSTLHIPLRLLNNLDKRFRV
jgi:hypothetical protein